MIDRSRGRRSGSRRILLLAALFTSCAYYNAMWNAEQFAKQARDMEQRGRAAEARHLWAQATIKAESVLARHPSSRWADDALVLVGEGLARSGDCAAAAEPLATARETVVDVALQERAQLAAAQCALSEEDPHTALALAAAVAESRDSDRRARAAYVAGRAALARGDRSAAVEWYGKSTLLEAAVARLRTLVGLGRTDEALAEIAPLARAPVSEGDWVALIDDLAAAAGTAPASDAVTRLLRAARLTTGQRARFLIADGDRLAAASALDEAATRYRSAARAAADSVEGDVARARLLRVRAAEAHPEGLPALVDEARALEQVAQGARAVTEARATARVLELVAGPHRGLLVGFRAAEVARDTLHAPALAAHIFLSIAADHPRSLFAPKAMISALSLDPPGRDSIMDELLSAYPTSPYTQALRGASTPGYAIAEDSLARAFGAPLIVGRPVGTPRWPPPIPGRRGPSLDVERARHAGAPRVAPEPVANPETPAPKPMRSRDGRPL